MPGFRPPLRRRPPVHSAEHYQLDERAARRRDDRPALGHALRHLSQILIGAGDPAAALPEAGEAVDLYRVLSPARPLDLANALRLKALALEGVGRGDEALRAWREARAIYEAQDMAEEAAECDAHLTSVPG